METLSSGVGDPEIAALCPARSGEIKDCLAFLITCVSVVRLIENAHSAHYLLKYFSMVEITLCPESRGDCNYGISDQRETALKKNGPNLSFPGGHTPAGPFHQLYFHSAAPRCSICFPIF